MRTSVASISKKFISTFFAATLALGLVPAAAFAVDDEPVEEESTQNVISSEVDEADAVEETDPDTSSVGASFTLASDGEDEPADNATTGDDSNLSIPAALERINEDVALTQPVAQQESTRSYFLAQILESTKTVPIVSANLPLDKGASSDVVESDAEGESNNASEEEGGEDSDESDLPTFSAIAADSTVIGSFEYRGMTFAVEPGGETVALMAVDYMKLPKVFPNSNAMAVPDTATPDGIDHYSVTRIAAQAFSSLTAELAHACVFSSEKGWSEDDFKDVPRIEVIEEPELPEDVVGGLPRLARGIKAVMIPASITSIDDEAFAGSDTLEYIVVEEGNPSYASYDGALYSADLTNLRLIPEGRVGTVRVAPSATTVEPEAFSHCPSVDTVVADPESEIYSVLEVVLGDSAIKVRTVAANSDDAIHSLEFDALEAVSGEAVSPLNFESRSTYDISVLNGNSTVDFYYANAGYHDTLEGLLLATPLSSFGLIPKGTHIASSINGIGLIQGRFVMQVGDSGKEGVGYWGGVIADRSLAGKVYTTSLTFALYYTNTTTRYATVTFNSSGFRVVYANSAMKDVVCTKSGYQDNILDFKTDLIMPNGGDFILESYTCSTTLPVPNFRTVTYNPNGGIYRGTTSNSTDTVGVYFDIPTARPTRTGYRFNGWYITGSYGDFNNVQKNSSDYYTAGELITASSITLSARWTTVHTITFDKDNTTTGSTDVSPTKAYYVYGEGWYSDAGATTPLTEIKAPTRPGYHFNGFSTAKGQTSGSYFKPGSSFGPASLNVSDSSTTAFSSTKTLYAAWQPLTVYMITLDKNTTDSESTDGTSPVYLAYGKGWYTSMPSDATYPIGEGSMAAPTRPGYNFTGYSVSKTASSGYYFTPTGRYGMIVAPLDTTAFSSDKTLYAIWSKKSVYTLTIDKNTTDSLATNGDYVTLYYWPEIGWYDKDPHNNSTAKRVYSFNGPSRPGYPLNCLSADMSSDRLANLYPSSTGGSSFSMDTYMISSDKTLYALWGAKNNVYKITLDKNNSDTSSTSGTTEIYLWYGRDYYSLSAPNDNSSVTYKITAPTRPGHKFKGYSTSKTATTASYWEADTLTASDVYNPGNTAFTSAKTLYAVWEKVTYTIKFYNNDGSTEYTNLKIDAIYGTDYVLPWPSSTNTTPGYTAQGWATSKNQSVKSKDFGSFVSNLTTTTGGTYSFYLVESPNLYTIKFYSKDGTREFTGLRINAVYDTEYSLPAEPTANITPGYTAQGWATAKNQRTKSKDFGAKVSNLTTTAGGTYSYYLAESPNTYTIKFYNRDGSKEYTNLAISATYDTEYALPEKPSTNLTTGYTAQGWATAKNQSTKSKDFGAKVSNLRTKDGDTYEYYLAESVNKHNVTWNYNGAPGKSETVVSKDYDSTVMMVDPGSWDGYVFAGWRASGADTGLYGYDGAPKDAPTSYTMKNAPVTFTAQWDKALYTVKWVYTDGAGNKVSEDQRTGVLFQESIAMRDIEDIPGYKFAGWKATGSVTGTYGKDAKCTLGAGDVMFTATWSLGDQFAVNLVDELLKHEERAIWYWPGQGYVATKSSEEVISAGSKILADPQISELPHYEFLGYFDENDRKMIDADGILRANQPVERAVTWYAHWKRVSCPVVLKAEYDGILYVTALGDPTSIAAAEFEKPFSESMQNGKLVMLPERTGYTFKGYYTSPNPELSESDVADNLFVGRQWIDAEGNLSSNPWKEYPTEERASITLYAAWMIDDIDVFFDVESNIDANVSETVTVVEDSDALDGTVWNYGKTMGKLPVPTELTFYRHGYDFEGWYYTEGATPSGKKVYASDSEGNPIPGIWMKAVESVTLYPEWTAKSYTLSFDANYPIFEGIEAAEVVERDFAYDDDFAVGDLKPAFKKYVFEGWYVNGTGELVLGYDEDGGAIEGRHVTHGRFTPQGDLALQTNAGGSIIELVGRWSEPGGSQYTLYAARPDGAGEVWERTIDYGYTETVVLSMAPPADLFMDGYRPAGWVEVASPTEAYEAAGQGGGTGQTTPSFGPLSSGHRYFVAKWTTFDLGVTLGELLPTDVLVDHEKGDGERDVMAWSAACGDDVTDPSKTSELFYDVKKEPFALPDVVRQGQVFKGWKRASATGNEFDPYVVVEPSEQAASTANYILEYVPVFEEATYTIILDANEVGLADQRHEVTYSGSFVFPYPTALNTGSCFACWADKPYVQSEQTKTFFPDDGEVPVKPVYDEGGKIVEFGLAQLANAENEIRLYGVWDSMYNVDVPLFANLAIDTETGDVLAGTSTLSPKDPTDEQGIYRIESLRYEPMVINDHTAFDEAKDKVFLSVYAGLSLGEGVDSEHLLYADNVREDGEVSYVGADKAQHKAKPLLIELGGDTARLYGRIAPADAASLEGVTDHDAPSGFVSFGKANPLTIRYGLYFAKPQTAADFAFGGKYEWLLPRADAANKATSDDPKNADYGRRTTWSSQTVDIARLCYTVSRSTN